jgi:SAM-dependent methyltransferase
MNPWLEICLEDYEGHMAWPSVAQAQFLAESLASSVREIAPRSVAVLGCAGGNGFDLLPPDQVQRVVGVDINPNYIAATEERYQGRFAKLELHCADVLSEGLHFEPVDFVFAGLLFEYVDPVKCLTNIKRMLNPGGHLVAVLQLPNASISAVTPTPFQSLGKLSGLITLHPPGEFEARARSLGFITETSKRSELGSGKAFHEFVFQNPTA